MAIVVSIVVVVLIIGTALGTWLLSRDDDNSGNNSSDNSNSSSRDDEDLPSREELSDILTGTGAIPEDQADCTADALLESDLNEDQLNAIAEDDESGLSSAEITEVGEVLAQALIECLS
jgi:bacillopeptidase F (M6 metalloprotease family)